MATELVKELRSIGTEKKKHEPMEYHPYKDETEMRLMIYNFEILVIQSYCTRYIAQSKSGKVERCHSSSSR